MDSEGTLPRFEGTGSQRLAFSDLDQRFELKIRGFIEAAMPPIFNALEKEFSLFQLRQEGIAPIMFYLDFEATPMRAAFGRPIESENKITLRSHIRPNRSGGTESRLIMDMEAELFAFAGRSGEGDLGYEPEKGPRMKAGSVRVLQVLTRPTAPKGERNLSEVPGPLKRLSLHNWEGEFPIIETIHANPEGFVEVTETSVNNFRSVWGLPNTDINQHVNVQEYIRGSEDHLSRHLYGAGLAVALHRINRAQLLFRKPFFPGRPYGILAKLFTKGSETVYLGGFYEVSEEGALAEQPNIVVRMDGIIRES